MIKQLHKSADELNQLLKITDGFLGRPVGRPVGRPPGAKSAKVRLRADGEVLTHPEKRWTPEHRKNFIAAMAKKRAERGAKKSKKVDVKKPEQS